MDKVAFLFLIFCLSVFIVFLLFRLFYTFYTYTKTGQGNISGETGMMPILNPLLIKLTRVRDYYGIKYRLIKMSNTDYKMLVFFDWNDLSSLLEKMKLERLRRLQNEQQIMDNTVSAFDQIASALDSGATANGEVTSSEKKTFEQVSQQSEKLLGIEDQKIPENTLQIPLIDEQTYYDIYRLLDILKLNMDFDTILNIQIKDRLMNLEIPLRMVNSDNTKVQFRFDPSKSLRDRLQGNLKNVKLNLQPIDLVVGKTYMQIYPSDDNSKTIEISL